ncbi:MAG: CsgG/HfaB family protein [Candidatus Omnitrophota bacterium]
MKRTVILFTIIFFTLFVSGCSWFRTGRKRHTPDARFIDTILSPYAQAKAKVILPSFDIKADKVTSEVGKGLRDMLVSLLIDSNRFLIAEQASQQPVNQGKGAPGAEKPQSDNATPAETQNQPDLIVSIAIIEFEPQFSGGRAGMGGGGGASFSLGGLLRASTNKAHIAFDVRIVNTANSETIASSRLKGQAIDTEGNIMQGWALSKGLSAYADTPMEKAIRICIAEATRYIAGSIPETFYQYKNGKT